MAARKTAAPVSDEKPIEEAPEPVLKISTLAPVRPTIDVDGELHELRMMRDFGIADQQELNRSGREFGALWNSEKRLTPNQQKRLKMLLDRLFAKVLIAPDEVKERFEPADKADVVLHFTLAPLRKMMAEAMAAQQTQTPDEEAEDDS
jgi:hypothetical protein